MLSRNGLKTTCTRPPTHTSIAEYQQYHAGFGLTKDGRPPRLSGVHSLPSIKAENMHARGFSAMAKQSFQNDRLGKNEFGLSSTGFNLNREALIDRSKAASSSKYGKSEIQRAHPGWNVSMNLCRHPGDLPQIMPSKTQQNKSILPTDPLRNGCRPRRRQLRPAALRLIMATKMDMDGSRTQF
jgi:hypothetical protein